MEYVVVRLRNNIDVIGSLKGQNDRGVDLKDACVIHYDVQESGYPTILLYKYCQVNLDFDVHFPRDFVANVFSDPIPTLVEYYERTIKRIHRNYKKAFDESEIDDLENRDDIMLAMSELYSANTTLQ